MLLSRAKLSRLQKELIRRKQLKQPRKVDWIDHNHKFQADFILDESRLKCAFTTRRSGKSEGAGRYLFHTADTRPGTDSVYLAKTRQLAKDKFFRPYLRTLAKQKGYKLVKNFTGSDMEMKINESELSIELVNGSRILCYGADATADDIEKLLGGKHPLIVIDEAQSWRQDLRDLVYDKLKPTTADYLGTICLIGTPGNLNFGLFYDITTGVEQDYHWSIHKWSVLDNPYMKDNILIEWAENDKHNPLWRDTPTFRMQWLGQWDSEKDSKIYKFDWDKQCKDVVIPKQIDEYMLGVDFGHSPDPSAFVVGGWSNKDKRLYVLESYKELKMDFIDVAERIEYYMKKYSIQNHIVVDGSAKQGIETIKKRYQLPLIKADKLGKFDHINLMNSDFITGNIKVNEDTNEDLIAEWCGLIWDEGARKKGKLKEHPGCSNHLTDAALYLWYYAYNYNGVEPVVKKRMTHQQRIDAIREAEAAKVDDFWDTEDDKVAKEEAEFWQELLEDHEY